jgi:hypothetical protein
MLLRVSLYWIPESVANILHSKRGSYTAVYERFGVKRDRNDSRLQSMDRR